MGFTKEELRIIYKRTTGYCHICGKKLSFENYGILGLKGAWEVEHSNPKSLGGTNRLNNLYAACIVCNREKNNKSTRSARAKHGRTRAPLSVVRRKEEKVLNAIAGGFIGGLVMSFINPAAINIGLGVAAGARIGYVKNPDKS